MSGESQLERMTPPAEMQFTNEPPIRSRGSILGARIGWAFLFLIPLTVVITATMLSPNPAGHSTHTQLGLPPCGFLATTGLPCPGCGLTTAFTNMVRFRFIDAVFANPFGVPLFLVTFFSLPISALGFVKGWDVMDTLERFHFEKIAMGLAIASAIVWVIRVVTILT